VILIAFAGEAGRDFFFAIPRFQRGKVQQASTVFRRLPHGHAY